MNGGLRKQAGRFWQWQNAIAAGWRVVVLVVLVGGRYLWVCANRPAHRLELADAYSIRLFYGAPQPNSTGTQLTYVSTAEQGFAVFLVNTASGQKRNVQEQNALGPWGSYMDLKVWPWSPDDSLFVYSASNHLRLCAAASGLVKGEIQVPGAVAELTWISPEEFVFIGRDDALYRVSRHKSGVWQLGEPIRGVRVSASSQNDPVESAPKAFDGSTQTKWYNNNRAGPWWLQYQLGSGGPRVVAQYRITSANDAPERDPRDWTFQGSNDGSNWVALDARHDEIFPERFQTKTYWVSHTNAYQAYRLYITRQAAAAENNMQLSELALFAFDAAGRLEEVSRERDPFADPASLQSLPERAIAWVSVDSLWYLNLASNQPVALVNSQETISRNTHISKASYSKRNGKFLLSCAQDGKPALYEFDPGQPERGMALLPLGVGIADAAWWNKSVAGGVGLVGRLQEVLVKQQDKKPEVPTAFSWANVESLTVTGDGKSVFVLGTVSNEPAAGIWQFDLDSETLRPTVAYADHPSARARRIEPLQDFILTDSGKYTLYLPADFYQHPKRKRPVVVGDTDFGFALRGTYGRMWAPAVAACNAFVIVVNRKDWFGGLDQWGESVNAAVDELSARLPMDPDRMYLFAVSAETSHLGEFLKHTASRWRGVMLLNPSGLPDLAGQSSFQPMPKMLISVGELERRETQLQAYQLKALNAGVLVDVVVAPGEKHHLVGNAAQRQRTRAMINHIFGD